MPSFKSNAQRKYLYEKHPKIAEEWEKETPNNKKLPEKIVKNTKQVKLKRIGKI